jgi:malate dehydrogenase (oxaloacetate-decarboxylating)(NADP+)
MRARRSRRIPGLAAKYTARGNLVAVITNGSRRTRSRQHRCARRQARHGRQGCLFKKFAGIDVFDIEVGESDPDKIIEVVAALEPTSAASTSRTSRRRVLLHRAQASRAMKIPVFHDDQHGTAIVAAAAVLNGLKIVGKDIRKVKMVCSGAGAAALACLNLQVSLGLNRANIL